MLSKRCEYDGEFCEMTDAKLTPENLVVDIVSGNRESACDWHQVDTRDRG